MSERLTLQEVALKVERAVGGLGVDAVMRTDAGTPMIAVSNPQSTTKVSGFVTAGDLYELASAVLYHKLERKGKAVDDYAV